MLSKIATLLKRVGAREFRLAPPEHDRFGEYATNAALLVARSRKTSPLESAERMRAELLSIAPKGLIKDIRVAPPGFINFFLSDRALRDVVSRVAREGALYGSSREGRNRTIIVEYPSVNIAKPMHVGHLRSAILGGALANLHDFLGYRVVRWDYLGDWGTQFGKLIAAYKRWGSRREVLADPIGSLLALYVRFHAEMKADPELALAGREEFRKLEAGDRENRRLWRWFRDASLKEFGRFYRLIGVRSDVKIGESFFEDKMSAIGRALAKKKLLEESEGALIVRLDGEGLPPALVRKSDGASLYLTRDLASLFYRIREYHPAKILYVVSNEQALYLEQVFAVARRVRTVSADVVHVKFGLVLGEGGRKFSTRDGGAVSAEAIIAEAIRRARAVVEKKNPKLPEREKERVARAVGIGAVTYNDLSQYRTSDIVFNWETMLSFTGDSAPYLQYTYARLKSVLRKAPRARAATTGGPFAESERLVARELLYVPEAIRRAATEYAPNILADRLFKLANAVNFFYESEPILKAPKEERAVRLAIVEASAIALKTGLGLLGIEAVERM
ncbi:MAG: arginine--tRNA ligase [Candidatus Colwellbacteria bacterium]|nr:arginine--tRNA ligase [Candidatus Colwellbacteria bacterium]